MRVSLCGLFLDPEPFASQEVKKLVNPRVDTSLPTRPHLDALVRPTGDQVQLFPLQVGSYLVAHFTDHNGPQGGLSLPCCCSHLLPSPFGYFAAADVPACTSPTLFLAPPAPAPAPLLLVHDSGVLRPPELSIAQPSCTPQVSPNYTSGRSQSWLARSQHSGQSGVVNEGLLHAMAVQGGEDIYATLLLSDSYLPGALVLAHSLRDAGTTKKLAVLVTLDSVSAEVITQLKAVYDYILPVNRIQNPNPANLYLMNRGDLHSAFTKINLWKLLQFRKIVYIDADVVAYRAPDELFELPHAFAAAPDIGWPDLFNTGVMVLTPNMGDYYAMMAMAERGISFDGADQGLLNMHFKHDHHRLSFTYNVTPSAHYQYIPAYRHFQSSVNMVHFIGADKPWKQGREANTGSSPFNEMVGRWWAVYDRHYRKETPTEPASSGQAQPSPELVQYFVKGEYHPTVPYVVPTGEPPRPPATAPSHGQHYHHHHPPPPSHSQDHHHHHQEHHHEEHHHEDQHHHHHNAHPPSEPPSQQSLPSFASFSHPSESFTTVEASNTEAREEQVSEPHRGAPRQPSPEPPQPPPQPSWDAQWQPPPANSKPEAINFPQTHYEMSSDVTHFVAPERYPSPPKNMWYEVPKDPPAPPRQKPAAIFPWERHQTRASRVFLSDEPEVEHVPEGSTTETTGQSSASFGVRAPAEQSVTETSSAEQKSEPVTPTTPTIHVTPSDPWSSFTRSNAWDDVPAIERYVDSLQKHRRGKSLGTPVKLGGVGAGRRGPDALEEAIKRRGSKVTDFPSEVERPSLPVTPAPVRRPKFWGGGASGFGDDEDEDDQLLPAAEGVPRQTDWDPSQQLEKLKQQHEILLQKLGSPTQEESRKDIPTRSLPFGSEGVRSPTYVAHTSDVLSPKPVKPSSGTSPVQQILAEQQEISSGPGGPMRSSVPEPSYHGPGAAWERDEDVPLHQLTPAPPTEEERDVLDT
ncbi:uncharacterized protein E0L32_004733 [Thyridium curvatum]|uniref:glycogenin glucosyltransferase n=1 Tax=Thyridium curvatum TaxID=1093900 RepID=A0A507AWL5_9PEZI|nr:uncharacterized protein E0L32_004733 [Thyridium curvatum]TPX15175.1 hypothetical protein E0L32_004733 [Thyridium curvatum]